MHQGKHDFPAYVRFLVSIAVLGVCLLLVPHHLPPGARLLISWNAAVLVFLGLVAYSIMGVDATQIRTHSQRAGASRGRVLLGVLLICLASLVAVLTIINAIKREEPGFRLQVFLCVVAVFMAWLLMQTVFGLFYARSYYRTPAGNDQVAGGLRFAGDDPPDYWDFIYFSFAIGVSYATSDTDIESRVLRRTVLLQSVVAFLFYTLLIGLVMNAIAALF